MDGGSSFRTLIITHCDFLAQAESGVDMKPITLFLSRLVDVDLPFILPIGKHTTGQDIEDFFFFSTLHPLALATRAHRVEAGVGPQSMRGSQQV